MLLVSVLPHQPWSTPAPRSPADPSALCSLITPTIRLWYLSAKVCEEPPACTAATARVTDNSFS